MRCSGIAVLFGTALLFLVGMLGQGMLISVATKNQQVATQIGMVSSMLPTLLLSGFLFPIENMPRAIQYVTYLIPVRYYAEIIRGVFLRGAIVSQLMPDILWLLGFTVIVLAIATKRFRKSLD